MAKTGKKRLIKFWKYYEQWYMTYKVNSVRGVTTAKYKLVLKWLKKLAPDLILGDMTREDLQMLINVYGQTHQKATVLDFYHHIAAAIDDAVYEGWTAKHLSVVSGISTVEISQIENGRIIATDYERDRLMYYLKGW